MFVQLKKAFMGKAVGERIDLADADAKALIESGTAEAIQGNPIEESISKGMSDAFGRLNSAMEKVVEQQLKAFADAQTKSRKNGTRMIFGENGDGDTKGKTFGDWLLCCRTRNEKRLHEVYGSQFVSWDDQEGKAAMNTQTGTQGGYTVPAEFLVQLMEIGSENAVVRPRANVIPMTSKSMLVPTLNHTTAPTAGETAFFGGLQANWTEEGTDKGEEEPTFKQLEIIAYELSGYSKMSNALMADNAVGLEAVLKRMFGGAIGWYEDYAFLRGDGVGKPLGAVNWAGFVSVTRSAASAFALADYAGVLARWLPNFNPSTACWACHPTVLAKVYQLASTLGQVIFIDNAREKPQMMLSGLPLVVTEKLPALNTAGDIFVGDWSKYIVGDRQQVEIAFSEHVAFTTNQSAWRFVSRVGGRPWLSDKITLSDATNSVSPFVGLAAA
jgi:HK97 family phage major capsid protein